MNAQDKSSAGKSRREIVITRVFDAPRKLVFDAFTKPEHVARWWGPNGSKLSVCEIDLRAGGAWRFVSRMADGKEYAFYGTYREVAPPDRLVYTQTFEQFPDNEAIETLTFVEQHGKTTVTSSILYESAAVRDAVIQSGMEQGAAESYDRLADHLENMVAGKVKVCVSRNFAAPAELVFDAWLNPESIGKWMFGPNIRDEEVLHLKTDPRVGGKFSFLVRRQDMEIDHVGTYRQIDRPNRLVFTWGIAGESADESEVIIDIKPTDSGCELTLTQVMDSQWAEYADRTEAGWTKMLTTLDQSLGS